MFGDPVLVKVPVPPLVTALCPDTVLTANSLFAAEQARVAVADAGTGDSAVDVPLLLPDWSRGDAATPENAVTVNAAVVADPEPWHVTTLVPLTRLPDAPAMA